ncbi:MAG: hypothetical protein ACK4SA_20870 [Caldilinea sp.]
MVGSTRQTALADLGQERVVRRFYSLTAISHSVVVPLNSLATISIGRPVGLSSAATKTMP